MDMFRDIQPVTLAPSLGCVQAGPDLASHEIDLYCRVVFETPNSGVMGVREASALEADDQLTN